MQTYYLPTGHWPLRVEPYHQLMAELGLTPTGCEDAQILLLPGGTDIGLRPERDTYEFLLYKSWSVAGKPVLGICRGMQAMLCDWNVPILEHIPNYTQQVQHTTIGGDWKGDSSWHTTQLGIFTNSRHHQGFLEKDIPHNWTVVDKTSDGVVEAVKLQNQFAVQWHPEHAEMQGTNARKWWIQTAKNTIT